ncbi:unnamed protein product [Vicia faba]|uniref:Uncharacterized protein n=1 Tax=Vicia faba TaxID=3906 RepID=A0AAV1AXV1_VICFA|nr:unnamed protein product [Vicia faba]
MEHLLELFKPKFLPTPEADPTLVVFEKEIQPEVNHPPEQQVVSQSETGTTSRADKPSEYDSMPLVVLKTLEELMQENKAIRNHLENKDEMFKE